MRRWLVASGLLEGHGGLLLVRNRRRDGRTEWSPPGGVIEVSSGEDLVSGLTREVAEETGIRVGAWEGPVWEVEAEAPGLGWTLRVEVHRAVTYVPELDGWSSGPGPVPIDDPDGIVTEACFVPFEEVPEYLSATWRPVTEPLVDWLRDRDTGSVPAGPYRYRIEGTDRAGIRVVRL